MSLVDGLLFVRKSLNIFSQSHVTSEQTVKPGTSKEKKKEHDESQVNLNQSCSFKYISYSCSHKVDYNHGH